MVAQRQARPIGQQHHIVIERPAVLPAAARGPMVDPAALGDGSAQPLDRPAEVREPRSGLGKRANNVSASRPEEGHKDSLRARSRRLDEQEQAHKGGRGGRATTEKDQPQHVRERVARLRRWQMQDKAAELAGWRLDRQNKRRPDRVADCLRKLSDIASGVEVRYCPRDETGGSAHYRGLQTCGSVWHCPICAAKISEKRRGQLSLAVERHVSGWTVNGEGRLPGSVWMTTYTASHKREDVLLELLTAFLSARRKMRQGRRGQGLRAAFSVVGTVSVLEVTWSPVAGWHVHIHELVFSSDANMDPVAYDRAARAAWKDAAAVFGLTMNKHGFRIDRTFGAVADYIAKFGHAPESAHCWGVESELSKAHIKQARGAEGMTPFALLAAATDGLRWAEPLWQEYAVAFRGRKQLNYSSKLKERLGISDESDQELVDQADDQAEPVTLVELSPASWDVIVEGRARGGLLELARSGRVGELLAGLAEWDLDVEPQDMTGWRVHSPVGDGELDRIMASKDAKGGYSALVWLDEPDDAGQRWYSCWLWDLIVLGDGERERAALLDEVGA